MNDPETMDSGLKVLLLARAIAANPFEGAARLWLQLFGVAPCDKCGFIKKGCRCNQKRKIPRRTWTKFCREARAARLSREVRVEWN